MHLLSSVATTGGRHRRGRRGHVTTFLLPSWFGLNTPRSLVDGLACFAVSLTVDSTLLGNVYPAYMTYNAVLDRDENRQRYLLMFW